ncbi:MAG TPA: FlgD immunoglobulin-like domain containing protein [bacterium]|nr:FlgD immunoglobulin-like domain containing protein [bacterium]
MKRLVTTTAVLAVAIAMLLPLAASAESDMSRLNRERKEIGRALIEVQSDNWPSVLQYYTYDVEYQDPIVTIQGIDVMTEFLARLFISTPDLVTIIEDEICINDTYMATWTMIGAFDGVPYSAKGMSVMKFRPKDTQVYYQKDYYTESDIMINIPGLAEPAEAFRVYYRCAVDPTFDCPLPPPSARTAAAGESKSEGDRSLADAFGLEQNAPNPFNPTTTIAFQVPDGGAQVSLQIYDVSGRLVRTLVEGQQPSGKRTVNWDGRDDEGQPVAGGIYFSRMTAGERSDMAKMILLK